jgi:hypothetical protein
MIAIRYGPFNLDFGPKEARVRNVSSHRFRKGFVLSFAHRAVLAFTAAIFLALANRSFGQPTDPIFTYQGKLSRTGQAASGRFDFIFSFWSDANAGAQVGTNIVLASVQVNSGIFSVGLPGGVDIFNGQRRWLGISVRPTPAAGATAEAYAPLPRQEITPAPYAITALNGSGLNGVKEFLEDGTFIVPNGVTRIMADLIGGGGSSSLLTNTGRRISLISQPNDAGGAGAYTRTVFAVIPGEKLTVVVGQAGPQAVFQLSDPSGQLTYLVMPTDGTASQVMRDISGSPTAIAFAGGGGAPSIGGISVIVTGEWQVPFQLGIEGAADPNAMLSRPGRVESNTLSAYSGPWRLINAPLANNGYGGDFKKKGNPGYVLLQW